ncbi:MAG TPA: hypothetical protein VFE32_04600 [Puia sp.]|jgi:hypothetical protein|nr:hypothetical protein [Puia sp.]
MASTPPPKPLMFVPREQDHKWIGNYLKKKHLALSHFIGKPETTSLYYSAEDFADMINRIRAVDPDGGVKLYFTSYCHTGIHDIDSIAHQGWMDLMTPVFAATDGGRNDTGQYFLIKPLGGVLLLSRATAQLMIQAYQTKKMPFLTTIIKDAGVPNFRETKSFWYPLNNFYGDHGIIQEMAMHDAAGITAFIGSYGEKDTVGDAKADVSWQMNVVFELVKSVQHEGATYYYHFDLENTPNWNERPDAPRPRTTLQGADTGNPCPPAICGGG